MSEISAKEFGQMQATVAALEKDLGEMRSDVREIRDAIVGAKGGWKTLMAVSGGVAALASGITWVLTHWPFK